MKLYLVSNNLLLENVSYETNTNLEEIRKIRTLSVRGLSVASKISKMNIFNEVEKIYSSFYSSALSTASFLSEKLDLTINLNSDFNECLVGVLGSKNMKMVKGIQDHDFNYKLKDGESLKEVGVRISKGLDKIINKNENACVFTHKRAILGFLTGLCQVGYNLDDNLILEYNNKIIYDDSDTLYDIYVITIENDSILDIERL